MLPIIASITLLGTAASAAEKKAHAHLDHDGLPSMSPNAFKIDLDPSLFLSDPQYDNSTYNPTIERLLYTKWEVPVTRPAVELGRQLFRLGTFDAAPDVFGDSNLAYTGSDFVIFGKSYDILKREDETKNFQLPQILVYGDFRTALAYNDYGDKDQFILATRLNLDVDIRFTASERIHAFFTPLNNGGDVTRWDIAGEKDGEVTVVGNGEPGTLFFEGDLARILGGFNDNKWLRNHDIPFTVGLIPLLFQNGTWLADAFTGFAVTIPARNSRLLDLCNMDVTFFAGFDQVNTGAIGNALVDDKANIYGVAAFIDAMEGYFELGYGYTDGRDEFLNNE